MLIQATRVVENLSVRRFNIVLIILKNWVTDDPRGDQCINNALIR